MKTSAFARRLSLSLLLLGAAGSAFATNPAAAPAAKVVADNPALHPTVTVQVVGHAHNSANTRMLPNGSVTSTCITLSLQQVFCSTGLG